VSSNIPEARRILTEALENAENMRDLRDAVDDALRLMTRKKPKYVAPRHYAPPTEEQKAQALALRETGWSQQHIANFLKLGSGGRVSEIEEEAANIK
jgi:hypothetical protein